MTKTKVEEVKAIELGRVLKHKEMGMPKNGKTWKYKSGRALTHKKYRPTTWKEKMDEKHRMKALRLRIKEKEDEEKAVKKAFREKQQAKKKNKEANILKNQQYQIIKDSTKIRSWTKKARKSLQKLPAEIFYQRFK